MARKITSRKGSGLPKHIRAHGSGFRAVLTNNGERIRSRTFPTVEAAQQWLALVLPDRDRLAELPTHLTLAQCMATLRSELRDVDARPGTFDFYETHAKSLINGLGGDGVRIDAVTTRDVQDYINERRDAGVSGATIVRKELAVLRRFLKIARAAGVVLPQDCMAGLRTPKVLTTRFGYLTPKQIADILAAMRADTRGQGKFWADVVELLFQTGIRRAELVRLRVEDIDIEQGRIFIDGKTQPRHQTFGKALEPVLLRLIAAAQADGRIVKKEDAVIWAFTTWRRKLKLREFSPHVLRHSYGTAMAERVSQWQLMGLMGHSNLKQTATYYHARGDDVRDALDGLAHDLHAPPSSGASPPQSPE